MLVVIEATLDREELIFIDKPAFPLDQVACMTSIITTLLFLLRPTSSDIFFEAGGKYGSDGYSGTKVA
jgi:hypothetical protein